MKFRALAAAATMAVAALSPLAASAAPTLVARTQVLNMNIGCEQAAGAGTCDSTEYWLGRDTGADNVGSTLAFTPMGYAFEAVGNDGNTLDFAGNSTLNAEYILRGGAELQGQITLGGFLGGDIAADQTITVEVTAPDPKPGSFGALTLASVTMNEIAYADLAGEHAFTATVPAALDGIKVSTINVVVKSNSVNLLTSGFMDGAGGSFIRLPYYDAVQG